MCHILTQRARGEMSIGVRVGKLRVAKIVLTCEFLSSMVSARDMEHIVTGLGHSYNDYRTYGGRTVTNFYIQSEVKVSRKSRLGRRAPLQAALLRAAPSTARPSGARRPLASLVGDPGSRCSRSDGSVPAALREHVGDQVPAATDDLREAPQTRTLITWHGRV